MKKQIVLLIAVLTLIVAGSMLLHTNSSVPTHVQTPSRDTAVHSMDMHEHVELEHPNTSPLPTITLTVLPDSKDGFNAQLQTTHFTFTPELVNQTPVPNQGHAHLYINGVKIGRLYGSWVHIPNTLLTQGVNTIEVTLNANDHSDWAHNGEHIGDAVSVTRE